MPYFSRPQLGVALLLGAALLLLWAWRGHFGLPYPPPPAKTLDLVFVEVKGAVAHPGVYSFSHPPTLLEVCRQAGGPSTLKDPDLKLLSGSRLEVTPEGRCQLDRMSGALLLTLGLAIDLNQATLEDLDALPGIGPALAQRIIEYRKSHGPFRRVEDLEQVSGIGPKKLEKIREYLTLQAQGPEAPEPEE